VTYENGCTNTIPALHDGSFDGLWLLGKSRLHLFVRTEAGERSTIVLSGVEAMNISGVKGGNIIFDLVLTPTEKLATPDIQEVYGLSQNSLTATELLRKAQQKGLSLLTINASYGASGLVLFETAEVLRNHVLPSTME
jgi:hypothetical protein